MKDLILKHALINAVQHGGKADIQAVIGKIIAKDPNARKRLKEIVPKIKKIVEEVNSLGLEKQKQKMDELGIEIEKRVEEERILPELPEAKKGKVVMRIAPNPNGPLHIGHARMAVLNDEYVKRYKGKLILRFDDTDPKNPNKIAMKEAYKWIEDDLKWLGVEWKKTERASAKIKTYYKYFKKLLKMGKAYVCSCEQEAWKNLVRVERKTCPCRENSVKENLKRWSAMLKWKYKEGQAVGRIKTPFVEDPAVIDWVAFRIVDAPKHPLVKNVKVWPMLDFASAIDDYDFKVTHIVRGKDLAVSESRQKFVYDYFGWKYPVTRIYGKFMTSEDMVVSKRDVAEGIKSGRFSGYDDARLVFLKALRRRGIQPDAIRNYILNLGLSEKETTVDLDILHDENKKLIDADAERYFVVAEPVEITLDRVPLKTVKAPLYPGKRKYRKIKTAKKVFIEKIDYTAYAGKEVRLMHFCNVVINKKAKVASVAKKDIPKIHWVSDGVKVNLVMPGNVLDAVGEKNISKIKPDEMVQFERIGYARCDKKNVFYFSHR